MGRYIYQYDNWPDMTWDAPTLAPLLGEIRMAQGRLLGRLDALGFALRRRTALDAMTDEVLHSSEIEGERLDRTGVRSSIAKRLGIEDAGLDRGADAPRDIDGVVEMMLDATQRNEDPLTEARLLDWHASLFPSGRAGLSRIRAGAYRTDAMRIVSGAFGHEKVHYQAPDPERLPIEMRSFLGWLNAESVIDPVLKAGVAHFRFVIIHPFDDGNGRVGRAITEMLLARADRSPDRYYSLSSRLLKERKDYYSILERCQESSGDVTEWLAWYLSCLGRALADSSAALDGAAAKADFWDRHGDAGMNGRQHRMVDMLLDGFKGRLTAEKWAKITKCSHDTALRDIKALVADGVLEQEGGGRNTSYRLAGG
jgi:Fic family protein